MICSFYKKKGKYWKVISFKFGVSNRKIYLLDVISISKITSASSVLILSYFLQTLSQFTPYEAKFVTVTFGYDFAWLKIAGIYTLNKSWKCEAEKVIYLANPDMFAVFEI